MTLADHPRLALGTWPTPLLPADRLQARLGCGPVLVKRDDLTGFALAGNKARPLEYLLGDALAEGDDTLVVGGAATSNFCQAAAIAARLAGLDCHIVLPGRPPPPDTANLALARAAGAQLHFSGGPRAELDARIEECAAELRRAGRSPLAVPRGGASPVGCLGFVRAAAELSDQLAALGHEQARIVLPVGSGASLAGLLVGAALLVGPAGRGAGWTITGVSVSRPLPDLELHLQALTAACAELLGVAPPDAKPQLVQAPGATHDGSDPVDPEGAAAARLTLHAEGLLLDPHYTAPAFALAVQQLAEAGPPLVFWHTGGMPAAISALLATGTAQAGADAHPAGGAR